MNRFEKFTIETLQRAKSMREYLSIQTWGLAGQYDINERHIRERLLELQAEKYIRMSAWDGNRDRPFEEWESADAFFDSTTDSGYKRIWLLIRGAEFLENLPQPDPRSDLNPRIGFTARVQ